MPIRAQHRSSPVTARVLLLLSVAALVALVAGCGSPEYTYVTNSTDRTYLKVPTTWRQIDGKAVDLPISAQNGIGGLGYSQITEYKGSGATATLQATVKTDASAPKSGSIADATLRIDRTGQASVIIPVAGAIGCA